MFHTNFNSLEGLHKKKGRFDIESNYQRSSQHGKRLRLSQDVMVDTTKGSNSRDTGNMAVNTISANSSRAKNVFPLSYGQGRNLFNIKIEDRNQFIVKQQQYIDGGGIFGGGPRVLKSQRHGRLKDVSVEQVTSKTRFSVKPPFLQDYITSFKQLEL